MKYGSQKKRPSAKSRLFGIVFFLFVALVISLAALFFTNKDFATELRQARQPKPNLFYIGIDVSQTISPDLLADFKDALILRLKHFIGEEKVSYHISVFGLPGCGREAIADIVSTQSPEDPASFSRGVEKRIRRITIAGKPRGEENGPPLTTPLFCFLERILKEHIGARIIIFSDLVNDDRGCQKQYSFPFKVIEKFGTNKEGQIIFLYPTPYSTGRYDTPELHDRLIKKQLNFVLEMQKLGSSGKARVFFYYIPDDPKKSVNLLRAHLRNAIPATVFEIIWERVSKMVDTIIGAVRG
jgi:hypothetical protein